MTRNTVNIEGAVALLNGRRLSHLLSLCARYAVKAPIYFYRWTLKPWLGWPCRHLPTCSEYALEAVDKNGAWKGLWLIVSRLYRCQPWGTAGFDPAPDLTSQTHRFQPWRYGRWTGKHIVVHWRTQPKRKTEASED